MYDVIIVGGGPAGMTAALYAQRNGRSSLVIEKAGFGGQITNSPKVENYPGTLSISGNELTDQMLDQILKQGAEIEFENVLAVKPQYDDPNADADTIPKFFKVFTEEGSVFDGRTVILATGVKHRMLGLPGEEDLVGEGISFCAVCDGDFYTDKVVAVAGGGNSALQEAILLADKCKEVILLQDLPFFTGEERLQEVLFSRPNVRGITGVKLTELLTDENGLRGVTITKNPEADQLPGNIFSAANDVAAVEAASFEGTREIACDGLFVAIGLIPENMAFAALAHLDRFGYFDTDESCLTRTPGLFAAGDCRSKIVRQVTTAAADGATAALAACRFMQNYG